MDNNLNFDTILELELSGSLAHFRKFYTNASSLTYCIPPRTSICGLVASILELPRDSYYKLMDSSNLGIAVAFKPGSEFHKQIFTMNYIGDEKTINNVSMHKQCRLELLMPSNEKELTWIVYLGFRQDAFPKLKERILAQNLGYNIYLGQRQFRASIQHLNSYTSKEFTTIDSSDYLDTVIDKDRVEDIDFSSYRINMERMPLEQTLEQKGKIEFRRTSRISDIIIETTGKRIYGRFNHLTEINNDKLTRIAFL